MNYENASVLSNQNIVLRIEKIRNIRYKENREFK